MQKNENYIKNENSNHSRIIRTTVTTGAYGLAIFGTVYSKSHDTSGYSLFVPQ
jgi:hypothetical protein